MGHSKTGMATMPIVNFITAYYGVSNPFLSLVIKAIQKQTYSDKDHIGY